MQFPDPNQATHYITEWEATWPIDPKDKHLYSLELVASKSLVCREREVMKYFISHYDYENFEINGCKLGMSAGCTEMPNSTTWLL